MKQHFVTFLSPGTFFSEETTKTIGTWDVKEAMKMAREIKERYGATPYGFYFTTRARTDADLDSKVTEESGLHYLGGRIRTLAEVEAENDPKENILRSNMRCNNENRCITNDNSWRFTAFFRDGDILLDFDPKG